MLECDVKQLVFSSTCATYGDPIEIPITEEHPQNPISPYGKGKFMVEQVLKDYSAAYGLRYVSLRYFNAAGADPEVEVGERHDPETHP
jgi:UDP-glucose 4-epimerase